MFFTTDKKTVPLNNFYKYIYINAIPFSRRRYTKTIPTNTTVKTACSKILASNTSE